MAERKPKISTKRAAGKQVQPEASRTQASRARHPPPTAPHPVEWAIGAVSALLVLALLVHLGWRAVTSEDSPPAFEVAVERIEKAGDVFHVDVAVKNAGGRTAAGVIVRASLAEGAEAVETGEIEFDFLPAGSTRHGNFVFARDPSAGELDFSVLGYTDP